MTVLAGCAVLVTAAGMLQAAIGGALVRRFRAQPSRPLATLPAVTVLKPLCGAEPLLEDALTSLCAQDYGPLQIVFGLQDPRDPACAVVARLQARFPDRDIALVVDGTPHGRNRKVANLINMLPAAKHDLLVIADSDVHAPPGYLSELAAALTPAEVGLVTTLYTGMPSNASLAARLGATGLTHGFLPGALMARAMGRQDCLGATMALRRDTLSRIGGFAALMHHLADDHVLGELVRAQGLRVVLAQTIPATTVPEVALADLYRHELRWARTIAAIVPVRFALSLVQFPLVWAGIAVGLSGLAEWSLAVLLLAWLGRALAARVIDRALGLGWPGPGGAGLASVVPIWLLPWRDLLSFAVLVASYLGHEVNWRGHVMRAGLDTLPLGTKPP